MKICFKIIGFASKLKYYNINLLCISSAKNKNSLISFFCYEKKIEKNPVVEAYEVSLF
jgi:hypothetical protein